MVNFNVNDEYGDQSTWGDKQDARSFSEEDATVVLILLLELNDRFKYEAIPVE